MDTDAAYENIGTLPADLDLDVVVCVQRPHTTPEADDLEKTINMILCSRRIPCELCSLGQSAYNNDGGVAKNKILLTLLERVKAGLKKLQGLSIVKSC